MKSSFSVGLNCSRKLHAGVFCKGEKAMNEAGLKKAKMKSLAFPLLAFMLRVLLTLHALGLPCNFCSKSSFEVATQFPFYLHFQPLFDATINIMVVLSFHDRHSHVHEDDGHDDGVRRKYLRRFYL